MRGAPDHPIRIRFEMSRENPIVMISVEVSASGSDDLLNQQPVSNVPENKEYGKSDKCRDEKDLFPTN